MTTVDIREQIKTLKHAGKCDWYGEPAHELMHQAADTMEKLLADRETLFLMSIQSNHANVIKILNEWIEASAQTRQEPK